MRPGDAGVAVSPLSCAAWEAAGASVSGVWEAAGSTAGGAWEAAGSTAGELWPESPLPGRGDSVVGRAMGGLVGPIRLHDKGTVAQQRQGAW